MRVLLLTQIVPYPPDSGPKIKTYNVLRYLARRHEVHLISFSRSRADEENAASLGRFCATVATVRIARSAIRDARHLVASLVNGRPFLVERDDIRAMRQAVDRTLGERQFDAIHADQLSMAQFAVDSDVSLRVLDEHNAVWTIVRRAATGVRWGPKRLLAELEWRKLKAYEGELCRQFDMVTVVSDQDRQDLAEAADAPFASTVIPIAVDTDTLAFAPRSSEARDIVSVATMFYPPNVEAVHWFATEVFPTIKSQRPDVCFRVIGSRPPPHVASLATDDSGIVVTGYVPDLDPLLRRSAVMVVPLASGSGMRVKILEAFARGIPVVSTTIGAEGIDAVPGEHLLLADTPHDFAQAVLRLLRDPFEGARLAHAARALVERRYDWRSALAALDDVYPSPKAPRPTPLLVTPRERSDALVAGA